MTKEIQEVKMTIKNCHECPHHSVEADPDPHDWFCDDDVKVVCKLANKNITCACRPYNVEKESSGIPKWCPLVEENIHALDEMGNPISYPQDDHSFNPT